MYLRWVFIAGSATLLANLVTLKLDGIMPLWQRMISESNSQRTSLSMMSNMSRIVSVKCIDHSKQPRLKPCHLGWERDDDLTMKQNDCVVLELSHICKTGGTSIEQFGKLEMNPSLKWGFRKPINEFNSEMIVYSPAWMTVSSGHVPIPYFFEQGTLNESVINLNWQDLWMNHSAVKMTVFSVIRDPLTRAVSVYKMFDGGKTEVNGWIQARLDGLFGEQQHSEEPHFVKDLSYQMFIRQSDYLIRDGIAPQIMSQFLLRFDHLSEDFRSMLSVFGIHFDRLPRVAYKENDGPLSDVSTDEILNGLVSEETKRMIRRVYEKDYEILAWMDQCNVHS